MTTNTPEPVEPKVILCGMCGLNEMVSKADYDTLKYALLETLRSTLPALQAERERAEKLENEATADAWILSDLVSKLTEAEAERNQLRAELAALKEALTEIAGSYNLFKNTGNESAMMLAAIARKALSLKD